MLSLYADYIRNGGTYMVVRSEPELRSDQLNRVQREMLASNTIPHLLRLAVREVDFEVSLHYEITGKRMLAQCLKSDRVSLIELYGLLLQVVTVLEDSVKYMLIPDNFRLDTDHIFVEEPLSSGVLYFTYVPLREPLHEEPIQKVLLSLIMNLLAGVTYVEGQGIQEVIRFCGNELFSISRLKKIIMDHLAKCEPSCEPSLTDRADFTPRGRNSNVVLSPTIKEYIPSPFVYKDKEEYKESNPIHLQREAVHAPYGFADVNKTIEDDDSYNAESTENSRSPKQTYYLLGAIVVCALSWKLIYLDHPGKVQLGISVLLTILIACGVMFVRRREARMLPKLDTSAEFSNKYDDSGVKESVDHQSFGYEAKWRWNNEREEIHEEIDCSNRQEYTEIPHQSEFVNPATVLLDQSDDMTSDPASGRTDYYLERRCPEGGFAEKIPLKPGSFVIGRSAEMAQYVEAGIGASRAHVEIMIRNQSCSLKDLGSRNGTRLDGEWIAPYKEYAIQPGNIFVIAESSFQLCKTVLP